MSTPMNLGRNGSAYTPLRRLADAWIQTPAPPETFLYRDVPDCAHGAFESLVRAGTVEQVGKHSLEGGSGYAYEYRWPRAAWVIIQNSLTDRYEPCPCGHSGLQNHGSYYTCSYDGCEREFARDELEVGT